MPFRKPAALVAVAIFVVAAPALARGVPTCKTPRDAVDAVFAWQQGRDQNAAYAARCLERAGRSEAQLQEAARHLKTVFDAEGVRIDFDKIPDDADYLDDERAGRFVPHATLPRAFVEKRDGRWLWPRESLDWIDARYQDRLGWIDKAVAHMPAPLLTTVAEVALWQYAALAVLVALGLFASRLFYVLIVARMRRATSNDHAWRGEIARAIAGPLAMAATAAALRLLYPELRLPVRVAAALRTAVHVMVTFALVWAAYRSADVLAAKLAEARGSVPPPGDDGERGDSRLDDHLVPIVRKAIKAAVLLLGVIAVLQNLAIDVTALFATLGIGTLAVGLAAKDTLANLFGSISIFVDHPFRIGDWINVEGVDGVVEEVGFRSTRLRTFYDSLVIIPNDKLANAKIDNFGKRRVRRVQFSLFLAHATGNERVEALCQKLRALLAEHPHVDRDKITVLLSGATPAALELQVTSFFRAGPAVDEPREKHQLMLAALGAASDAGVELASVAAPAATPVAPPAKSPPAR